MYESPCSLQECCVDFVCENLTAVCASQCEDQTKRFVFKDSDCHFHSGLSEHLLRVLCQKSLLTNQTLALFDASRTSLNHVKIFNASSLTTEGLRILRSHKISRLEAIGLQNVSVNDLIGCLGDWTLQNLRWLNVANSTFVNSCKFCVVVSLSKLRALETLNVSCTEFNKHGLEIVTEDLLNLKSLDISCTRVTDISPLLKCKDRLGSLSMYNLKNTQNDETISVLLKLTKLHHLDVSNDKPEAPYGILPNHKISNFLLQPNHLLELASLDISGKQDIEVEDLRDWLDVHHRLKFLGLVQTDVCYDEMFSESTNKSYRNNLVVTGSCTEEQILHSLRRYSFRPYYIQKSLFYLFRFTQSYKDPRPDVIKLVLPAMRTHPKHLGIQMAATACLYNLSKGECGQKIHPHILSEIVDLTLVAMESYPNHPQLQKNTLLTLCSDRILQDVSFNRYKCAYLVMDCLCTFDDPSMNRMSVAICSILAAKISTAETSLLGSKTSYMLKLLNLVKDRTNVRQTVDTTMKFTLSALWNLTDESPSTCNVFLEENGLDLFLKVLDIYEDQVAVETKVLGLLNNIAEVPHLRSTLMRDDFLHRLQHLLKSSLIDVSYFAAGIVAHLASDGHTLWSSVTIERHHLLEELSRALEKWESPDGEMVAYRSFQPFIQLMKYMESWEVQLWAIWAIQHVCSKNPKRYCEMLVDEGGDELLKNLISNPDVNERVIQSATTILQMLQNSKS